MTNKKKEVDGNNLKESIENALNRDAHVFEEIKSALEGGAVMFKESEDAIEKNEVLKL